MKTIKVKACFVLLVLAVTMLSCGIGYSEENDLGLQSTQAIGEKRVLIVAVRFPDATPTVPIEKVKQRATSAFNAYVSEQSYGLSSINYDFRGYIMLPNSLSHYKVSQYNNQVDADRVRNLIEDTMTVLEKEVDFSSYDHMLIIPAVFTTAGTGYGMICYCANPGMVTPIKKIFGLHRAWGDRGALYETLRSKGGKEFKGGVFVGAENANLGMFAHDYFHALGGIYDGGKRFAPCLYDYGRQSDASSSPTFEKISIYMGPWDIMSQHFIKKGEPPPGLSSFTKIRLGWIKKQQVQFVKPGETSFALLSPLSKGGNVLVVKIPVNESSHYLIENRQPVGFDRMLPDSGILILEVHPNDLDGTGVVKVKPSISSPSFDQATYKLEESDRNVFIDKKNNIAIIPLWEEKEKLGVLVTTPDRSKVAINAAIAIQKLINQNLGTSDNEKETVIVEAIAAFKNKDFEKSYAIATRRHEVR